MAIEVNADYQDLIKLSYQPKKQKQKMKILKKSIKKMEKIPSKRWSEEEIEFLLKNKYKSTRYLSKRLKRSIGSISGKLHWTLRDIEEGKRTKIPSANSSKANSKVHNVWSKEEINHIKNNIKTKTLHELSQSLNRSENSVSAKIRRLGLNYPRVDVFEKEIRNPVKEIKPKEKVKSIAKKSTEKQMEISLFWGMFKYKSVK